jgi:hypothetical protein
MLLHYVDGLTGLANFEVTDTRRRIIAIEQEARTLARAEVIAEAKTAVEKLPESSTDTPWSLVRRSAVLAALSRLGERE